MVLGPYARKREEEKGRYVYEKCGQDWVSIEAVRKQKPAPGRETKSHRWKMTNYRIPRAITSKKKGARPGLRFAGQLIGTPPKGAKRSYTQGERFVKMAGGNLVGVLFVEPGHAGPTQGDLT